MVPPPSVTRFELFRGDTGSCPNIVVRFRQPLSFIVVSVGPEVGDGLYQLNFGQHVDEDLPFEDVRRRDGLRLTVDSLWSTPNQKHEPHQAETQCTDHAQRHCGISDEKTGAGRHGFHVRL